MRQQGAIVLGIGGDNSNRATGEFFEGVMTSGSPSASVFGQCNPTSSPLATVGRRLWWTGRLTPSRTRRAACRSITTGDVAPARPQPGRRSSSTPPTACPHRGGRSIRRATASSRWSARKAACAWMIRMATAHLSRSLPQQAGSSTMLWQVGCNGNPAQNWKVRAPGQQFLCHPEPGGNRRQWRHADGDRCGQRPSLRRGCRCGCIMPTVRHRKLVCGACARQLVPAFGFHHRRARPTL